MRIKESSLSLPRYSAVRYNGRTTVTRNDVVSFVASRVERSPVLRNEKALPGAWRRPLPYFACVTGADSPVFASELVSTNPNLKGYTITAHGKLGFVSSTPFVAVTRSDLDKLRPSRNDINTAIVKARNNLANRVGSFLESLAEIRGTVSSLGSMAQKIDRFLLLTQQRKYAAAARVLGLRSKDRRTRKAIKHLEQIKGTAGDAWLSFWFGLSPIVSDMVSTAVLLGGDWSLRVKGSTVFLTSKGSSSVTDRVYPGGGGDLDVMTTTSYEAGVQCRLDYLLDDKYLRNFSSFGALDVPAVAWALVPYSFLVDFVVPLGESLRSLTSTHGLVFLGGSTTSFVRVKKAAAPIGGLINYQPAWSVSHFDCTSAKVSGLLMNREVYSEEPNPFVLRVQDPFNAFSVITSLALLDKRLTTLFSR